MPGRLGQTGFDWVAIKPSHAVSALLVLTLVLRCRFVLPGLQRIRVVPRIFSGLADSSGLLNNLSIITKLFYIF